VYLAAWVLGGVLLGASMLLDGREATPSEIAAQGELAAEPRDRALVRKAPIHVRMFRLLPLGLIGFGLCGLTAKGLGLDLWPWTQVCALSVGLSLVALGYGLSRTSPSV
jgi:hypothetical protein